MIFQFDMRVFLACFAVLCVSTLTSLATAKKLFALQRDRHPESWDKDGRPAAPLPQDLFRGAPAQEQIRAGRKRLGRAIFVTPDWADAEPDAQRLLWIARALRLVGVAAVAVAMLNGLGVL